MIARAVETQNERPILVLLGDPHLVGLALGLVDDMLDVAQLLGLLALALLLALRLRLPAVAGLVLDGRVIEERGVRAGRGGRLHGGRVRALQGSAAGLFYTAADERGVSMAAVK